jgi:hypothetical protein
MTPISSWVIVNKETYQAVFETFKEKTANSINQSKYKAVPILEYLQTINAKIAKDPHK